MAAPETGGVHAEQVAEAVLRAPRPSDKVQGILALQALGSDDALDQLLRILKDDPTALRDGGESQALSKALASYGVRGKTKLLRQLAETGPGSGPEGDAPPVDLFDTYFASAFDGARTEIGGATPDAPAQAKRLERLQAARADLEQALHQIGADTPTDRAPIGLPSFVLRTLLQMDLYVIVNQSRRSSSGRLPFCCAIRPPS